MNIINFLLLGLVGYAIGALVIRIYFQVRRGELIISLDLLIIYVVLAYILLLRPYQ